MLALIGALATNSAQAAVATWEHFGADKAYTSREAAIADAPKVLKRVGYPEPVIALLTEAMKNPGTGTYVTNGMKFDFMRSGKDALWRNVLVKFTKPPIKERMEYSAPAEEWSVDWNEKKWTVVLPAVCFNLLGKPTSVPPQKEVPPKKEIPPSVAYSPSKPIGACPDVYLLKVNVWDNRAFYLHGVELTHAKEDLGLKRKFQGVPHVSRTHGKQFREAYAAGSIGRSAVAHRFQVSLIMTPGSGDSDDASITEEQILGDITVTTGLHELRFTRAQLERWNAIRLVEANGDVVSPPASGLTGLHELRFFNRLPGKKLGEWDNNPVPDCIMNQHWIESPK